MRFTAPATTRAVHEGSGVSSKECDHGFFAFQHSPRLCLSHVAAGCYLAHPTTLRHVRVAARTSDVLDDWRSNLGDATAPSAPEPPAPFQYFLDQVRDRATYSIFQQALPRLSEMLTQRNMAGARELAAQMTRAATVQGLRAEISPAPNTALAVMEDYALARNTPAGMVRGVPTGFGPLDHVTSGLHGGDIVTIAARPNIGKSWKMIKMAAAAWQAGHSVGFISMEMSDLQTMRRLIGLLANLNPDHIRRGRLSTFAEQRVHETIGGFGDMPPFHMMSGSFRKTTTDVDRMIQEFAPDVVFIDASYLMSPEQKTRKDGSP